MIYLVFSDESGVRTDSTGYYIRSWVTFPIDEYVSFESRWRQLRGFSENELKWSSGFALDNNFITHLLSDKSIHWSSYITFTDLEETPNYSLVQGLQQAQPSGGADPGNFEDAKSKAIEAVRGSYFLNTKEVFHFQTMLEMLYVEHGFDRVAQPVRILVDKPQYLEKDLAKITKKANNRLNTPLEASKLSCVVENSKHSVGIQLADLFAGSTREYVLHKFVGKHLKARTKDFLSSIVVPRLVGHGNYANGMGKVMWNSGSDQLDTAFWDEVR